MMDEDVVVELLVKGSKALVSKVKSKAEKQSSRLRFVRANGRETQSTTTDSRGTDELKSCQLLTIVYDRAKEFAESLYPTNNGVSDSHK
jgi:hypothetical protein